MGRIISSAYEWWQSLGPVGLALEFLAFVAVVSAALWITCQTRSSVFWRRTDYAYFFFAILGGAAGAADLAVSNWSKTLEQNQISLITNTMLLSGFLSTAMFECNNLARSQALFSPGIIDPEARMPIDTPKAIEISREDCLKVERVSRDFQDNLLKNVEAYGIDVNSRDIFYVGNRFLVTPNAPLSLMAKLGISIQQVTRASAEGNDLQKQLSLLNYLTFLKGLSPILLGLGIGIRLARTHYDVRAEERKQSIV
jgi:hypothetical protein